jgi:hypothetical protein
VGGGGVGGGVGGETAECEFFTFWGAAYGVAGGGC